MELSTWKYSEAFRPLEPWDLKTEGNLRSKVCGVQTAPEKDVGPVDTVSIKYSLKQLICPLHIRKGMQNIATIIHQLKFLNPDATKKRSLPPRLVFH